MLRIATPLSAEVEKLVHDTIGCGIAVHRTLGLGMLETVYSRALAVELRANGIAFEREKPFPVYYRGECLCEQRLDFVVANPIVVEIKSVELRADIHHVQLLHYLRVSKLRAGLLINFNLTMLKRGIVRKVL
jgi:GxxExxY protein